MREKQLNQSDDNFFDKLGDTLSPADSLKQQQDFQAKADKLDYLIHKVFEQSEDGQQLLELWHNTLIMTPTADAGMDSIAIGINEGYKRFIRGILLTVKKVENQ